MDYGAAEQIDSIGISVATAHPGKFPGIAEDAIGQKVAIPERLSACLNREKYAAQSSKTYEDFKSFLIDHSRAIFVIRIDRW
ncbi:MAG: hypothetical protein GY869_03445 [Planctomycetes bacterium]|nr:hypothetical protein [Planctomycetota bacterium]